MMNEVVKMLAKMLPKIEKLPSEKQIKILWTLVLSLFADMETAKALLENRTPPDNTDLRKVLENALIKEFQEF